MSQVREEPKYEINIEGALKPWDKETITTEENRRFRRLGPLRRCSPHQPR